ncbi:hypothetical protein CDD83_2757 [Cordyceps sp. RAO-2017]|nr:hypothetical protein CDD83_2757 [Cordyceps sp. RAO-2017]
MCYQVVSHMMCCDARPLLSSGRSRIVDTYAQPRRCGCAPAADIKGWLRCEHHGCCRASTRTHLCVDPDSCGDDSVAFHRYLQTTTTAKGNDGTAWSALAALDQERFPCGGQAPGTRLRFEAPVMRQALDRLRRAGRQLHELEAMTERWAADARRLQQQADSSSSSPAGLADFRCVAKLLQSIVGRGAGRQRELVDDFDRARRELRTLERWGERRVTGLNDDDGGEATPEPLAL